MGIVYRVTNVALGRVYALKVLAPELADDEQFRQRFQREMRIAASIDHPNVVIHGAGHLPAGLGRQAIQRSSGHQHLAAIDKDAAVAVPIGSTSGRPCRQPDQVRLYRRRRLGPDPEGASRHGGDGLRDGGVGGRRTGRSAVSPCALAQDHSARRGQLGDLVAEVAKDRDSLPLPGSSGRSRAQRTEDVRATRRKKGKGYAWMLTHAGTGGGR